MVGAVTLTLLEKLEQQFVANATRALGAAVTREVMHVSL